MYSNLIEPVIGIFALLTFTGFFVALAFLLHQLPKIIYVDNRWLTLVLILLFLNTYVLSNLYECKNKLETRYKITPITTEIIEEFNGKYYKDTLYTYIRYNPYTHPHKHHITQTNINDKIFFRRKQNE